MRQLLERVGVGLNGLPPLEMTWSTRSSALERAAMRAARRMTVSLPGAPVTATRMRSAVSHTSPDPWVPRERRNSSNSSSVSSATKRSEARAGPTRFSMRKNPDRAGCTLAAG